MASLPGLGLGNGNNRDHQVEHLELRLVEDQDSRQVGHQDSSQVGHQDSRPVEHQDSRHQILSKGQKSRRRKLLRNRDLLIQNEAVLPSARSMGHRDGHWECSSLCHKVRFQSRKARAFKVRDTEHDHDQRMGTVAGLILDTLLDNPMCKQDLFRALGNQGVLHYEATLAFRTLIQGHVLEMASDLCRITTSPHSSNSEASSDTESDSCFN